MKNLTTPTPLQAPKPTYREVALLAWKFYLDSNREDGYEIENWLCAEYMLRQKQLIQLQVSAIHGRKPASLEFFWAT